MSKPHLFYFFKQNCKSKFAIGLIAGKLLGYSVDRLAV